MFKKLLVFDLDGTLINSQKDIISSFNYSFKKNKCKKINKIFFLKNANRGSVFLIKKNLKLKDIDKIKIINNDFINHYKKNCTNKTRTRFGVKFFLEWSSKKFINVVSTNKSEILSKRILKKLNLYKYIDQVFGSDTLKFKKPDPRHLKKILKIFKIKNKNCYFFGDSDIDSLMAKKTSVNFIFVKDGYVSKDKKIMKKTSINNFYEAKNKLLKL